MKTVHATQAHVREAIAWAKERGIGPFEEDMFSPVGFVVEGMAGCWLYLTGSTIAYGEMLISNPAAPKAERRAALKLVIARVLFEAQSQGCRTVMAPSAREDVSGMLLQQGFVSLGPVTLFGAPLAALGKD